MTHKQMTRWIRALIKRNNIPATVRMFSVCGVREIQIIMNKERFENGREWSKEEAKRIHEIAKNNKLTLTRKTPINIEIGAQLTGKEQFNFEYHGE